MAVQRLPQKRKKKKVAQNFLKFGMEVYNTILSTCAKDGFEIPRNEGFCSDNKVCCLPRADFALGCATAAPEKEKKKSCSEFSQIWHGSV